MRVIEFKGVWEKYQIKFIQQKNIFWEEFWALEDIDLVVNKGQVIGIIGENGAGKTTLLKLIAGILVPDKGEINVRVGFEIDYFKNQVKALNSHLNNFINRLDYILGSIHILDFKDGRGAWGFDDSRFRKDFDYYGPQNVFISYYKKLDLF